MKANDFISFVRAALDDPWGINQEAYAVLVKIGEKDEKIASLVKSAVCQNDRWFTHEQKELEEAA